MAIWEQEPKGAFDLLKEYVEANYLGVNMSCDAGQRLIHLEIESIDDKEMGDLISKLKATFPGAF